MSGVAGAGNEPTVILRYPEKSERMITCLYTIDLRRL